jgi:hypothetical protein
VGWAVWALTFVFAVTVGVGFASTNIADTPLARASRVTPAVAAAQATLSDAMSARDRECKGGVGRFCREREAAVNVRRQGLDAAMHLVEQAADPQTEAAIRLAGPQKGPAAARPVLMRLGEAALRKNPNLLCYGIVRNSLASATDGIFTSPKPNFPLTFAVSPTWILMRSAAEGYPTIA